MSLLHLIFISLGFIAFGVFMRRHEQKKNTEQRKPSAEQEPSNEEPPLKELNEKFIRQAQGKEVIPFVKTYNINDRILIRSLLDSVGICTYLKPNSFSSLYPGVAINNHTDSILSIFTKDMPEARKVVLDYIEDLKNIDPEKRTPYLRHAAEYTLSGVVIPTNQDRVLPEILVRETES